MRVISIVLTILLFSAQDDAETLEAIRDSKENNNGRIDDTYIIKFFRDKLKSMPCQNQGFLLDGFPKTLEQAKDLFARKWWDLETKLRPNESKIPGKMGASSIIIVLG